MVASQSQTKNQPRQRLDIRAQFGSIHGKRYGDLTFSFEIDEQDIADAMRGALCAMQGTVLVALSHNGVRHIVGKCTFGGLTIKRSGDSILKLDTSLEDLRLQIQGLRELLDEYVKLRLVVI